MIFSVANAKVGVANLRLAFATRHEVQKAQDSVLKVLPLLMLNLNVALSSTQRVPVRGWDDKSTTCAASDFKLRVRSAPDCEVPYSSAKSRCAPDTYRDTLRADVT